MASKATSGRTFIFAVIATFASCAPEQRRTPPTLNIGDIPPPLERQDLDQQRPTNYNPPSHRSLDPESGESSNPELIR